MNILSKLLVATAITATATSCSSFLDINDNPNQATSANPDQLLANALTVTANNYTGGATSYNHYASFAAGYWGKSGVVNGYTEERTYNYTSLFQQNLWFNTYDNLNDYNIIQTNGAANGYPNHAAIARIMKAYNFLLLVDQYGDIPYSNALKGAANTTPSYDKAADIYKDLIVQLDGAITDINAATSGRAVSSEDVVFGGNMVKWKQFANSLKLRILLRESQTNDGALNDYVKTQLASLQTATDGFITTDVLVQPGYNANTNQQNPFWNRYGYNAAGANATEQLYQIPTNYIINQYVNNKDPRVSQLYQYGIKNGSNQVYVGTDLGERSPAGSTATLRASFFLRGGGLLKGANAPTALMLLSEHLFNKAEAETRGLFTGGNAAAKADFNNGILASFIYFYRPATGANTTLPDPTTSTAAGVSQYNSYIAANTANPLVNFDLATSNGSLGKQSVILYQKYLAENSVASAEAWADYRRAAQPKFPASLESNSPRADKLPTRLLYPQTEINTNQKNIPTGVDQFTKIFWDVVD
ncbi:SusD/RagB family nutrient-binding outer membrane lipoprotein [Hymenobacter pini]|uniref:SusD/RagB family nutrient-binding outer membrane lipoprotein n=1 Tax=Hymenobacter pini TaxID=2880879 RepID=UPI001CF20833|nr:SusD/RagB family nutrient-binding outer membrane lipoprotein [Hymenobacter pini]MCA8831334.1 SusD/RagB family nutrient-binding outer membrane lipoprotein [Hymenobacter pini]